MKSKTKYRPLNELLQDYHELCKSYIENCKEMAEVQLKRANAQSEREAIAWKIYKLEDSMDAPECDVLVKGKKSKKGSKII